MLEYLLLALLLLPQCRTGVLPFPPFPGQIPHQIESGIVLRQTVGNIPETAHPSESQNHKY